MLRWGLGAVVIMLIVSTVVSIAQKVWPKVKELGMMAEQARSLDQVTSLAQTAWEAFEKYQALNDERTEQ